MAWQIVNAMHAIRLALVGPLVVDSREASLQLRIRGRLDAGWCVAMRKPTIGHAIGRLASAFVRLCLVRLLVGCLLVVGSAVPSGRWQWGRFAPYAKPMGLIDKGL